MAEQGWPKTACIRGRVNSGREVRPRSGGWPASEASGHTAHSRRSASQEEQDPGASEAVTA
jgi:hypothetical protein